MSESNDVGIDVEEEEVPVGRIGAAIAHKQIVAEWAAFYINAGYEVRVEQVSENIMEGVAW